MVSVGALLEPTLQADVTSTLGDPTLTSCTHTLVDEAACVAPSSNWVPRTREIVSLVHVAPLAVVAPNLAPSRTALVRPMDREYVSPPVTMPSSSIARIGR